MDHAKCVCRFLVLLLQTNVVLTALASCSRIIGGVSRLSNCTALIRDDRHAFVLSKGFSAYPHTSKVLSTSSGSTNLEANTDSISNEGVVGDESFNYDSTTQRGVVSEDTSIGASNVSGIDQDERISYMPEKQMVSCNPPSEEITEVGDGYGTCRGTEDSGPEMHESNCRNEHQLSNYEHVDIDELIENAFEGQPKPKSLCAMACRGSVKDELINHIISRLAVHKRKRRNAPHMLYVCLSPDDVEDFMTRYSEKLTSIGKVNVISASRIGVSSHSMITIGDSWSLFGVYNVLNSMDTTSIMETFRRSGFTKSRRNVGQVQLSPDSESVQALNDAASIPDNDKGIIELKIDDINVDETNQEDFVKLLKQLTSSFMRSHDDILETPWSEDVDFTMPKEALLPMRTWMLRSHHTPEQLSQRLLLDEAEKRVVLLDGFNHSLEPRGRTVEVNTFDEILMTLKKECQVMALAPGVFSPQNISQWMNKIHGPVEFVTAQKWPEFRVFYGNHHFDPFDFRQKVKYSWNYISQMRQVLSPKVSDPTSFFNVVSDKPGFLVNAPWNEEFKPALKDVLKDALATQGIDTLHKLKHESRDTYDYVKKYIGASSSSGSLNEKDIVGNNEGIPPQSNGQTTTEPTTIDEVLNRIIDLDNYNLGSAFMRKVISRDSYNSMIKQQLHSVVDRVIEDGIFPAVIYLRSGKLMELYRNILKGRFQISEEIKKRLKECGLENSVPDMLEEGVATIFDHWAPEIVKFVKDNLNLFNIVVTHNEMSEARHHICHKPTGEQNIKHRSALLKNIQQAGMWLGAERVTYWGIFPLDVAHSLASFMVHSSVDFSGYNPQRAIAEWTAAIPETVQSKGPLIQKMEKMTFASYMKDCHHAYMGGLIESQHNMRPLNDHRIPNENGNPMQDSSFRMQPVDQHDAVSRQRSLPVQTPIKQRDPAFSGTHMKGTSPPYTDTTVMVKPNSTVGRPLIRSMLDRHDVLTTLESKLHSAGVDMQSFYLLDMRIKQAHKFDNYIKRHVRGFLRFKCSSIGVVADAISLSGTDILGNDERNYTAVWIGGADKYNLSNINVSPSVQREIQDFFKKNRDIEVFAILKRGEGYICVPAFFIKDILALPKFGTVMDGSISQCTTEAVSIIQPPGMPPATMPAQMPYLVLTNEENHQPYVLPSTINAESLLVDSVMSLVRISHETWQKYHERERELIEDATDKLMKCSSLGINTREKALDMLRHTREVHRNRSLGGLEPYLRQRQALNRTWGYGHRNVATPVYH